MAERQVVFYECQDIDRLPAFDRIAALNDINDLDDDDWTVTDGDAQLGVIVDRVGGSNRTSRLRFLRIRQEAPYLLSAARDLTPLAIQADEAISEFTYIVMWPDGFMGGISSRDAPGHKRLAWYLRETSGERTHIVNLFQPDVVERLRELRRNELRKVSLRVQTSKLAQIEADGHVTGWSQLFNAGRGTDAATFAIEVSVGRQRHHGLSDSLAEGAEELALMGDLLESMIVRGRNDRGDIETINMKQERVRAVIDIDGGTTTTNMYRHIESARNIAEQTLGGGLNTAARGN
jgi:hypothetical protein